MTCFVKLPALLLLFLLIKDSSSFPLVVREVQDIEKNSVVLEDIQSNQQITQEEKFGNMNLVNMINPPNPSPLVDNWLAVEDSLEEKKQGGENEALRPKLSDLLSFTKKPTVLGYWNWHWRRK